MNIQATSAVNTGVKSLQSSDDIDRIRNRQSETPDTTVATGSAKQVQPEELINQIKAITENGLYSVQFESNENAELIVKIIDRDTNEIIRQIPPEELIELAEHLKELTGNLVDTIG